MKITISSARVRRAALAATVCMATVAFSACSLLPALRDPDSNEVVGAGSESAFDLQVGDCFNDETEEGPISNVAAVPCGDPHDNEVYFTFDLPDGEFPGEESVTEQADEGCFVEFEKYVGMPYDDSELDFYHLSPTRESWAGMSDREVTCAIWDPAGQTTGSLRDAGR